MTAIGADGQTFVLRVWIEDRGPDGIEWRAKLRHLPSGETRYFREWETLREFVVAKLGPADDPVVPIEAAGTRPALGLSQSKQ